MPQALIYFFWTVMRHFSHLQLDELNGSNIHRAENVITLSTANIIYLTVCNCRLNPRWDALRLIRTSLNKYLRKHSISIG